MRILALIILFFFTSYTAFWFWSASSVQTNTEKWFKQEHSNISKIYGSITVKGFPNRIDTSLEKVQLSSASNRWVLDFGLVQIFQLIYKAEHKIISLQNPINLRVADKIFFSTTGEQIKSSVFLKDNNSINQLIIENNSLAINSSEKGNWKVSNFIFAAKEIENIEKKAFKIHFKVDELKLPKEFDYIVSSLGSNSGILSNISLDGEIEILDKRIQRNLLSNINAIKVNNFQMNLGAINPTISGTLHVENGTNFSGKMQLRVADWKYTLNHLEKNNLLEAETVMLLRGGLYLLMSQKKANPAILQVPLSIKNNQVFLGPIKILNLEYTLKI